MVGLLARVCHTREIRIISFIEKESDIAQIINPDFVTWADIPEMKSPFRISSRACKIPRIKFSHKIYIIDIRV